MNDWVFWFVLLAMLLRRSRNLAYWQPQKTSVVIRHAVLRWLGCVGLIWLILTLAIS
jgi:hypothetical protein